MSDSSCPASLTVLCEQLADLTASAAEEVRQRSAVEGGLPASLGEFFEGIANVHLDIAQAIANLHRDR